MLIEIGFILYRIWAIGALLFLLNAISRLMFKPSFRNLGATMLAIMAAAFWWFSIFSPEGRKVLFNKLETM